MNIRNWQQESFNIIDHIIDSKAKTVIPVNACVGSGKTLVSAYALAKFIERHKSERTVQIFVTPRIRLCDQQAKEISDSIEVLTGLKSKKNFNIVQVDCTKNEFNRRNDTLVSKHTIFVICDKSLWGLDEKDPKDPEHRWCEWLGLFNKWEEQGIRFGFACFDEAHNFENQSLKITDKADSIGARFNVMLMSGTPSAFQIELTSQYNTNECACAPKTAMDNGWICRPTLNLVNGHFDIWPAAIVAALNREVKLCAGEKFSPRIMVNCSSIDDIKHLLELDYFKDNMGKKFHLITLHSDKDYSEDNIAKTVKPTIDGVMVSAEEAYSKIEAIDDNKAFKDKLPILVAQVQMLGEGINVKSFNAIITASNSHKTAMQQIGRCVRNYFWDGAEKVKDGHANVYIINENIASVHGLLSNLQQFHLTHDCFTWGHKIDINNGSSNESIEEELEELNKSVWKKIDEENDPEIIILMGQVNKRYEKTICQQHCDYFVNDTKNMLKTFCHLTTDHIMALSKAAKGKGVDDAEIARFANTVAAYRNASETELEEAVATIENDINNINTAKFIMGSFIFRTFAMMEVNPACMGLAKRGCEGLAAVFQAIIKESTVAEHLAKFLSKKQNYMNYFAC